MQRFILKRKNTIALISFILLIIAFGSKLIMEEDKVFNIALIIASIIGLLPILIQAIQALRVKVISIDLLVTIAVIGAFIIKEYEESAIVTFLFLFGGYLELKTLNKTRSAIKELTLMAPETALKQNSIGEFELVDIEEVNVSDILLVKTGSKVPVDGIVLKGEGYINEATITGESMAVLKEIGTFVYAGTILENGTLQIEAQKVGEDTTFGKIIELVEEAQDSKSSAERFIDKFAKYYTPAVLILALIVFLITKDIPLAITVLVLGCPGALVIGVPVSNVAGIGNSAKNGVLLKGSETINDFSRVTTIVFDKTGTLTIGKPELSEMIKYSDNKEVLNYLASVENEAEHPLAKAILNYLGDIKLYDVSNTNFIKGGGITANVNNNFIVVGNLKLMKEYHVLINDNQLTKINELERKGNSVVITALNNEIQILMGIKDQIRPGIKNDLQKLKKLGVKKLIILSGDNQGTVDLVAKELNLTEAHGNMLPADKANYIKKLQQAKEVVAFVGDGINDSPSLATANIGIAMGNGTDVAIETSDVVLINDNFKNLPHALGITKKTAINMKQNIVIAVGTVIILLLSLFIGDWMNMSIGMLVHEASILVVILNGMRLLRYKMN